MLRCAQVIKRETRWIIQTVVLGKQLQSNSFRRQEWTVQLTLMEALDIALSLCVCVVCALCKLAGEVSEDRISLLDHWMLSLLFLHGESTLSNTQIINPQTESTHLPPLPLLPWWIILTFHPVSCYVRSLTAAHLPGTYMILRDIEHKAFKDLNMSLCLWRPV